MLSRIAFALGYALTFFVATTGVALAYSDAVRVGVGTFVVVMIAMGLLTVLYVIKWYFGATEPPPLPPGGLPYHSVPAGGHAEDAHGAPAHH